MLLHAICGNVHRASDEFRATEHAVVTAVKSDINIDWYYYMLIFMNLNQYSKSDAQSGISVEKIQNLRTIIPPLRKQKVIVDYIEKETTLIDKTITRAEREIELIQEHRTHLVSDMVTGTVNVRGIEVPELMEEQLPADGGDYLMVAEDKMECIADTEDEE